MDKTEEYIEMCRNADDIQALWIKKIGDYYFNPDYYSNNKVSIIFDGYIRCKEEGKKWYGGTYNHNEQVIDGAVWLPRQDQLQEMIDWEKNGLYGVVMIDAFYDFSKTNYDSEPFNNTEMSWERLWLSFVMHELYKKRWTGTKWVSEFT